MPIRRVVISLRLVHAERLHGCDWLGQSHGLLKIMLVELILIQIITTCSVADQSLLVKFGHFLFIFGLVEVGQTLFNRVVGVLLRSIAGNCCHQTTILLIIAENHGILVEKLTLRFKL